MPDINEQIDQMAEALEKATKSPKEQLFDTIKTLGKDGIKAKLLAKSENGEFLLNDEDRQVLKSALEEMNKAVSMDDAYQATYVKNPTYRDTVIQEDKADDDQDEKLVKPKAAKMDHQGTPTDGWEGQVIKAKEVEEKKEKDAKKKLTDAVDDIAEEEVKEHEKDMHGKKMEKCNDAGQKVMGEKYSMKKSKEELDQLKDKATEILKSEGVEEITDELVKGKMKALLMEEKQVDDKLDDLQKEKDRGDKARPEDLKIEKENKEAQDKVNDVKQGQMKKAIEWSGPNSLLKAGRGGQSMHFNVNKYYDNALAKAEEPQKEETLEKSENKEEKALDTNDYIEKSLDMNRHDVVAAQDLVNQEKPQFMVKSFADNEIAAALGLTEEEAKQILGE